MTYSGFFELIEGLPLLLASQAFFLLVQREIWARLRVVRVCRALKSEKLFMRIVQFRRQSGFKKYQKIHRLFIFTLVLNINLSLLQTVVYGILRQIDCINMWRKFLIKYYKYISLTNILTAIFYDWENSCFYIRLLIAKNMLTLKHRLLTLFTRIIQ